MTESNKKKPDSNFSRPVSDDLRAFADKYETVKKAEAIVKTAQVVSAQCALELYSRRILGKRNYK